MYFTKTPDILKPIASDLVWDIKDSPDTVYITFDDGPHPEITPEVLTILDEYEAKGTFFCVGENVKRFPDVVEEVRSRGHSIGNHSYSHENGWETRTYSYLKSYLKCQELTGTDLFRPPYGRIKREQVRALKDRTRIIMWDVLSGDWRSSRSPEKCAATVIRHSRPGSIIVFHDSLKAARNVLGSLPLVLDHFRQREWNMAPISWSEKL